MKGTILNITRYCTHDGPGIRTTVFLKGCPLRCLWCHNPESQSPRPEIALDRDKCAACGQCAAVCHAGCIRTARDFSRADCTGCGKCASACPTGALTAHGKHITVEELLPQLLRDRAFFAASGGGVTLSGGEPMIQSDFTMALLAALREAGVHTAVETCGFASEEVFRKAAALCDLLLFDIKETDPVRHQRLTGAPLEPVLRNLHLADALGVPVLLRVPIIPTLNDRPAHFEALRALRESLKNSRGIEIMPYHQTGAYKYTQLDMSYACEEIPEPTAEQKAAWQQMI